MLVASEGDDWHFWGEGKEDLELDPLEGGDLVVFCPFLGLLWYGRLGSDVPPVGSVLRYLCMDLLGGYLSAFGCFNPREGKEGVFL